MFKLKKYFDKCIKKHHRNDFMELLRFGALVHTWRKYEDIPQQEDSDNTWDY